jgi:hypothetical protein
MPFSQETFLFLLSPSIQSYYHPKTNSPSIFNSPLNMKSALFALVAAAGLSVITAIPAQKAYEVGATSVESRDSCDVCTGLIGDACSCRMYCGRSS